MNKRTKRFVIAGAALAITAGGVGGAVASGVGEDEKEQVSGAAADRARDAALAAHPGTANAVERDSENGGTWEVEITGKDGRTVDVRLDENYKVLVVEGDGENDGSEDGSTEDRGEGE